MGLSVREVLAAPCLARARVLAGASGLDRVVTRLNVMEVPDILPWVKPHELLLTTGYPVRDDPAALADAMAKLAADSNMRARFGANARALVERKFSAEAIGKQTVALYDKLLKPRAQSRSRTASCL